jgi:hypothetical protein
MGRGVALGEIGQHKDARPWGGIIQAPQHQNLYRARTQIEFTSCAVSEFSETQPQFSHPAILLQILKRATPHGSCIPISRFRVCLVPIHGANAVLDSSARDAVGSEAPQYGNSPPSFNTEIYRCGGNHDEKYFK